MSEKHSYHESLLHWIWDSLHFEVKELRTRQRFPVQIHKQGQLNLSDGPDFTGASITIGKLKWHGDVEIHWDERDWNSHGHNRDIRYNQVILHVVYDRLATRPVLREDGTAIPTLILQPYLNHSLQIFIKRYHRPVKLPCSGHLPTIPGEVIIDQLDIAHQEYFEQKLNDLFKFFDSGLPVEKAWLNMLAIALFDGLGISHNRKPMRELATRLLEKFLPEEPGQFALPAEDALEEAGLDNPHSLYRWNHKGCRPPNHPAVRIPQGVTMLNWIFAQPFDKWLSCSPGNLWEELLQAFGRNRAPGRQRASILFGTAWVPALYLLGNLYSDESLQQRAHDCWIEHKASLPGSLIRPFKEAGFPAGSFEQRLGSVYQLKTYCKPRRCQHCKVFKSAITA